MEGGRVDENAGEDMSSMSALYIPPRRLQGVAEVEQATLGLTGTEQYPYKFSALPI